MALPKRTKKKTVRGAPRIRRGDKLQGSSGTDGKIGQGKNSIDIKKKAELSIMKITSQLIYFRILTNGWKQTVTQKNR